MRSHNFYYLHQHNCTDHPQNSPSGSLLFQANLYIDFVDVFFFSWYFAYNSPKLSNVVQSTRYRLFFRWQFKSNRRIMMWVKFFHTGRVIVLACQPHETKTEVHLLLHCTISQIEGVLLYLCIHSRAA